MDDTFNGWQRVLLIIIPYFLIVGAFQLVGVLISGIDLTNIEGIHTSQQEAIMLFFTLLGTFFYFGYL